MHRQIQHNGGKISQFSNFAIRVKQCLSIQLKALNIYRIHRKSQELIPTASHPEAQSEPVPALQPGDRIWYLSIEPAAVQLRRVVQTWTGPWILACRVAPDLYQIKSCNLRVLLTVHVGRLRHFRPGFLHS